MTERLDLVLDSQCALGECPVWSPRETALYFVDIKGMKLHRLEPETKRHTVIALSEEIGCFAIRKDGGFIAGLRSGVWHLAADGSRVAMLAPNPEHHATNRFNDGRTDPRGRFFLGTIDEPKAGATAGLYRFDKRGLAQIEGGLTTSNGLAFSPDGRVMYHSDTPRFTIYAYDYDVETGTASNRRIFAQLQPNPGGGGGRPDGGAVDVEGCYWTALYDGGRVQRYSPTGELLAEYQVPAGAPTMVAFGGADMKTLYITSARDGRPADELARLPHSGGIFSLRTKVPGVPEPLFDPEA
ncbi:SMP-30/gluconolactonase/LRE family protein [Jiella sp. MQZ9-1]|uniref:SMP-30/gluconolactonase/LRE family protein n=1 Tax=Jiella flava TaxID=2816857 RepID=A0A939JVJ0_9HYPH|nr:SMP-30/gluconolactonase/LRE family protein [Jiella flava]MBO0664265.1 SMP-30/gluconolactonase/LRE family protein [Jiella flava]MCD2472812.1 SMP-30/gluconolactonase/LRE family protein [Jiella flava]